jgi:hypothetical protein
VSDELVLEGLSAASKRHTKASWALTLNVGKLGSFRYVVAPDEVASDYLFRVISNG